MSDEETYRATIVGMLEVATAKFVECDQFITPELIAKALEDAIAEYSRALIARIPDIVKEWFREGGAS